MKCDYFCVYSFSAALNNSIQLLIENDVDVNVVRASDGADALILAAKNGLENAIELLVNAGADVNRVNIKQDTALSLAAKLGICE